MFDFEKKFDRIYCLSLSDNIERRKQAVPDFERIGIMNPNFEWKLTVRNPFYKYIWNNPGFRIESWWKDNETALNCTMGHYEIMKESLALGYDHVLILEDDCRFHKSDSFVWDVFENTPEDYDICLYDKFVPISHVQVLNAMKYRRVNHMFFDFSSVKLWSCACYALSRKAMESIVAEQERFFQPADHVINRVDNSGKVLKDDGLVRVAAIKNAAVQEFFGKKYSSEQAMKLDNFIYTDIVERDEYNVATVKNQI